jgi:hypothetical protein
MRSFWQEGSNWRLTIKNDTTIMSWGISMRHVNLTSELTLDAALERLGETYQSIDASALVRSSENEWENLALVIRFGNETTDEIQERHEGFRERFGNLFGDDGGVLYEVSDFDAWDRFEKRFSEGYVDFAGRSVKTCVKADDFTSTLCRNFSDTTEAFQLDKFPRISCQIPFDSGNRRDLREDNFAGVALNEKELAKSCLGFDPEKSYGVLVVVPIYCRVSDKDFSNAECPTIGLLSHPSLKSGLECALVQKSNLHDYRERVRKSTHFENSALQWTEDNNWVRADLQFPIEMHDFVRRDVVEARLAMDFGIVDTEAMYLRELIPLSSPDRNLSPPVLSALSVCEGWMRIEEMLGLAERRPPFIGKETDAFLFGVSWILEVIGFRVVQMENSRAGFSLGRIRTEEDQGGKLELGEIDILASDDENGVVYAIDCTMNPPASKKADSLSNCADFIESAVGVHCNPVIFVATRAPNSKDSIKTTMVIDRDDISQMLDLITQGEVDEAGRLFDSLTLGAVRVSF